MLPGIMTGLLAGGSEPLAIRMEGGEWFNVSGNLYDAAAACIVTGGVAPLTFLWTVPGGVTIMSGQGTSGIQVRSGSAQTRTVSVLVTDALGDTIGGSAQIVDGG